MTGRVFNNKLERRAMGSYVGNRTRSITFFPPVDQGKVDGEREEVTLSFPLWPGDPAQQDAAATVQGRGNASQSICFRSSAFPTLSS